MREATTIPMTTNHKKIVPSNGNNNNNNNTNNNNNHRPGNKKITMSAKPTPGNKPYAVANATADIPIFLRKTYQMIDTCDAAVCSWSEDGETFVVKNPTKFEQEIIPQYFKHSKFTSFVRQLNFYAFRKIKTNDSIRIDPALEAATADHWRFLHPKFQRGKPEWLQEIKRSSSTPRGAGASKKGTAAANKKAPTPDAAASSGAVLGIENSELKSEVTTLKERIEAMNKNIDMLTTMVQNVSMAQKTKETEELPLPLNGNNKRTKVAPPTTSCVPDVISSSISVPDAAPSMPSPVSVGTPNTVTPSNPLQVNISGGADTGLLQEMDLSGEIFVDRIFTPFKKEEEDDDDILGSLDIDSSDDGIDFFPMSSSNEFLSSTSVDNADDLVKQPPRSELMDRLSDAMSLLPRQIQELIVDRLIQAITSPKEIKESLQVTQALEEVVATASAIAPRVPTSVPQSPRHSSASCDDSAMMIDDERSAVMPSPTESAKQVPNPSLPLAAATLAALLAQYGKEPQCTAAVVAATNVLIPVHV